MKRTTTILALVLLTLTPVSQALAQTAAYPGAIATTNPEYQFNILPNAWNVGAAVGELAKKSLSYPVTGAITRDVTP